MARFFLTSLLSAGLLFACTTKEFDPDNLKKSFVIAKEPYDDGNYEIAINKLGEFKSRFPYSQFATEAELLLANSHFELSHYPEATAAYSQFIKLHPKHPKRAFAQFRIGQSYWADAPEEIDREQDFTAKAIHEWEILIKNYPKSEHTKEALKLIEEGKLRTIRSEDFIANFYCKQEIWHACAWRYVQLADTAPAKFKDMIKNALEKASDALDHLAEEWTEETKEANLYFKKMTPKEMREQAKLMRQKAAKI